MDVELMIYFCVRNDNDNNEQYYGKRMFSIGNLISIHLTFDLDYKKMNCNESEL